MRRCRACEPIVAQQTRRHVQACNATGRHLSVQTRVQACCIIGRVPVPQVSAQPAQASHAPTEQSTGQTSVEHARRSSVSGHASPSPDCAAVIARVRAESPGATPHERYPFAARRRESPRPRRSERVPAARRALLEGSRRRRSETKYRRGHTRARGTPSAMPEVDPLRGAFELGHNYIGHNYIGP